ncbi:hypothetical protein BJX70DRAFT_396119 [Aspergillus crustosus]
MPISITTTGTAALTRPAELAMLRIKLRESPKGRQIRLDLEDVMELTERLLQRLGPIDGSGIIHPNAAITDWKLITVKAPLQGSWLEDLYKDRDWFRASSTIEATFREFGAMWNFIKELKYFDMADLDVNSMEVEWGLMEETNSTLLLQVRTAAIEEAKAHAQLIASALGKHNITAVKVQDQQVTRPSKGDKKLSCTAEEVEVEANVTVEFTTE